jgi:hypothetical protein
MPWIGFWEFTIKTGTTEWSVLNYLNIYWRLSAARLAVCDPAGRRVGLGGAEYIP